MHSLRASWNKCCSMLVAITLSPSRPLRQKQLRQPQESLSRFTSTEQWGQLFLLSNAVGTDRKKGIKASYHPQHHLKGVANSPRLWSLVQPGGWLQGWWEGGNVRGPCLCLRGFCLAASTTAKKQWVLREAVPDSKKEATEKGFCYWKACIQTDACRKDICWRGKKPSSISLSVWSMSQTLMQRGILSGLQPLHNCTG